MRCLISKGSELLKSCRITTTNHVTSLVDFDFSPRKSLAHQSGSKMTHKTVLITGCSEGGIGDVLARECRRRVFASARNPKKMQHFANLGIETLVLDVVSKASIEAAVQTVDAATEGRLDYLINAAGSRPRLFPTSDFSLALILCSLHHAAAGFQSADR
jgi:NAD(P)-dependent dehydrogenase (short-subunit alcohol dehydrogenase family)